MTIVPKVRSYEELAGGQGRDIYFRAPRIKARELFDLGSSVDTPIVKIGDTVCQLVNLSLSGLAAIADDVSADAFELGTVFPLELRHAQAVLHSGYARIVRTEPVFRGLKVAVQLVDSTADLNVLRQRYSEEMLRQRVDVALGSRGLEVEADYRVLCADVLMFLRTLKETLAVSADIDPSAADTFLRDCEEKIWPVWAEFFVRGNRLMARARAVDGGLARIKEMSQILLTPEFMSSPIWRQTISKPFGYPGDFVVMGYVYDRKSEGETLYDKLIHRLGVRSLLLIQTRMRRIVEILKEKAASHRGDGAMRVLNLGCGAAREIALFLREGAPVKGALVTLIDQDERALSHALEGAYREVLALQRTSQVRCLQASFSKLIEPDEIAGSLGPQDFVYSIGLLDYLPERRARALVDALYGLLAPGGTLLVGNLRACPESGEWCSETICDWPMVFRTEQDMWGLAANLQSPAKQVFMDPLERVYLLQVEKPLDA